MDDNVDSQIAFLRQRIMEEAELLKLAERELISEARRAAIRYSIAGPSGWTPCPLKKTNKTFLANTLLQTVSSNRIKDRSTNKSKPKFRERKLMQEKNKPGVHNHNIIFKSKSKEKHQSPRKDKRKLNFKNSVVGGNKKKNKTKPEVQVALN